MILKNIGDEEGAKRKAKTRQSVKIEGRKAGARSVGGRGITVLGRVPMTKPESIEPTRPTRKMR